MRRHIAFLDTSAVHVKTSGELVSAIEPAAEVDHVVDEQLLADAQRPGAEEPSMVRRVQAAMAKAASHGAAIVVCTCSTIGGAAEHTATGGASAVARIDRAMADRPRGVCRSNRCRGARCLARRAGRCRRPGPGLMAPAAVLLDGLGVEVLASPALGKAALAQLHE